MKKGDIVLIPFPFSDLSGNKLRPAVILIVTKHDVTLNFITTQTHLATHSDIIIEPSEQNGLKLTSLIRVSKFATIDKELVVGLLGSLEKKYISKLNKNLIEMLRLV